MIENEMNETCYDKDWESTNIKTEFNINGKLVEIEQRRLSVYEVDSHRTNIQSAFKDPKIYKSLLAEDDIEKKIAEAKLKLAKAMKKSKQMLSEEELEEELRATIEIDDETKYLIFEAKLKITENNKLVNTKFVMYSSLPSELYGGYFRINGKQLEPLKIIEILKSLNEEDFKTLYENANKLSYPTKSEIEEVKS